MTELFFEKLSRFPRLSQPCTISIPFRQGQLTDVGMLSIEDEGKKLPTQKSILSTWPDGSVKWVLVNFLVDLPGNNEKKITMSLNEPTNASPEIPVLVCMQAGRPCITTGDIQYVFSSPGEKSIFYSIDGPGFHFSKNEYNGPTIYDENGNAFTLTIDETGWSILENGPVRVVLFAKGRHLNSDGSLLNFEIRIEAYASKPYLMLDYRIINKDKSAQTILKGIKMTYRPKGRTDNVHTSLATSNYRSNIIKGQSTDIIEQAIDSTYLLNDANEQFPETLYGTFWADWSCPDKGGVCATIFQAYQNFPKALKVSQAGMDISILPDDNSLTFYQGMAKTHRVFLHFHDFNETVENLNVQSLQFQMPDRPILSASVYKDAGVFEDVFPTEKISKVETSLISMADQRLKAYGILHWGDAPDPGYTEQGREGGKLVWTNNEYDYPHAMMLMYARTGERRMLDYHLVSARHQLDVDICHFSDDPLRYQGQISHSAHHTNGEITPSHEWVEGLLDYYHQTGDIAALEGAIGIGENILRILKTPKFQTTGGLSARETGWALRTIVALYKETHDKKWLKPADSIVDDFEDWKNEYGGWLAPYTDHTIIRVPFMISIAVNSLMRYYRIKPQERIKSMILSAVYDMVENCIMENRLFYYKELPSLRRLGNNPLVLEALCYAYELSGDIELLKAGLPTFDNAIEFNLAFNHAKKAVEDAVIVYGGASPKRFAQYFLPIAYYYKTAQEAGIL